MQKEHPLTDSVSIGEHLPTTKEIKREATLASVYGNILSLVWKH
jgi:hypothetical protein